LTVTTRPSFGNRVGKKSTTQSTRSITTFDRLDTQFIAAGMATKTKAPKAAPSIPRTTKPAARKTLQPRRRRA
jgi:hypothetical protein